MSEETKIVLVDDHVLLRSSLARVIDKFTGYRVIFEADHGQHFIDQLPKQPVPDVVLLDINMPVMNGFETAKWIKENLPDTKILVLSMLDNETHVIRMLNAGACGYILKDSKPSELKYAFDEIMKTGYYANEMVNSSMIHYFNKGEKEKKALDAQLNLNDKEIEFLSYTCTELTYKEIGKQMNASSRTIDNYRDALFLKLDVKSRVGLALFAIRGGYFHI